MNWQDEGGLKSRIDERVEYILEHLQEGHANTDSSAYDTAWVARLAKTYPGYGFERSLKWIREHQHPDGCWGSSIVYYHDRVISTLSAVVALLTIGDSADKARIRNGEIYLRLHMEEIRQDAVETIAYPWLFAALLREARALGLDLPDVSYKSDDIEKKLRWMGPNPFMWRKTTMMFSYEALYPYFFDRGDLDLAEANGSIADSPAATAAYILSTNCPVERSLRHLQEITQPDGSIPCLPFADVFDMSWTLIQLYYGGLLDPYNPHVKRIMKFWRRIWNKEKGIVYSTSTAVHDLDDTSVVFHLLRWAGYPVNGDVFCHYDAGDHFRCYENELHPSLSVNIRVLNALQHLTGHPSHNRWKTMAIDFLRTYQTQIPWVDKWHVSAYYISATFIQSCSGMMDDLLQDHVNWILSTQRHDGGWGAYGTSTAEETSYGLLALIHWHNYRGGIDTNVIHCGADYLLKHAWQDNRPPFWIGKTLFYPRMVVDAAILSALNRYRLLEFMEG